ncbi:MAG: DUF4365 domain-containing protein [Sphingomonas sp.]|uniref:DUF4365 domain-containing protein n=1 Tax=Sphingomonas sp. TaxID=28214 RepID=UPI001AFE4ACE|nr:DUF4365 domain-containing protein [Sphingomonas sp.]MBO9621369.1 DUF4365 domain-containing protein [Sphingomonas sp.]
MAIETTENDIKERLSIGYVALVSARAGCQVLEIPVDRESCDIEIRPVAGAPVRIDVQLKATVNLVHTDDMVSFALDVKNYNDLCATRVANPQYLVVLDLPDDSEQWLSADANELVFKRCAFWLSLKGQPRSDNVATKTVHIPKDQVFNPESLTNIIMERFAQLEEQGDAA